MIKLILSTLKQKRMTVFYYSLAGFLMLLMYVLTFPSIKEQLDAFNQILKSYPPAFLKALGIEAGSYATLGGYLVTENFGLVWPIILGFLTVSLGSSLVAGEIESGTMGLLLAQPISRAKIYWSKYLASVLVLVIFAFFSVVTIWPLAQLTNLSISFSNTIKLTEIGLMFGVAMLSMTFFFSSLFSEKGRVNGIMAVVILAMYVLNLVSNLKEGFSKLHYGSFFYYYNPSNALQNGSVDHLTYEVFIGIIIVFALLGVSLFTKRDITV